MVDFSKTYFEAGESLHLFVEQKKKYISH